MIVIGIDPGTATTGYGVIESAGGKLRPIDYGVMLTPAGMGIPERLKMTYDATVALLTKYNPDEVATERLFFSKNETTAMGVGRSIGVILLAIAQHGVPWVEYTPMQVKQGITGVGSADKKQVQFMVTRLLNLKDVPKPDDAADALAIAICHAHTAPLSKLGVTRR